MKIKISLLVLVAGYIVYFFGAWLKISHQSHAETLFIIGTVLKAGGLLLLVVSLLTHPRIKAFLREK
ncbi:MAG: hypothetical protein P0Y53_09730 [Candidatus Pseudobacter hemicellulosilyticus]|uniref:Uncharacterized protein n=1 Tax=Candidatus Pseudobacter hemicellulosilyticus TaxID=3121375 RepID=A0AAJ5WT65_9BACT|nr:MAG: hypothetical protein P0Y53_09730 [Pseudobacter sp.]